MNIKDWTQFAEDLRRHTGLSVEFYPSSDPESLHVLQINGVDFYLNADGTGYDGWGARIAQPKTAHRTRRGP